jgi:hypothetical protein
MNPLLAQRLPTLAGEVALGGVVGERDRGLVRRSCLDITAQPAQQIGAEWKM